MKYKINGKEIELLILDETSFAIMVERINELIQALGEPSYEKVELTQGKFALVDTEDFKKLSKYNWSVTKGGSGICYATRWDKTRQANLTMHRAILGVNGKEIVDHINGDGLDNRKVNLRLVDKRTNSANTRKNRNNPLSLGTTFVKSKFKLKKPWRSTMTIGKKRIALGNFITQKEANDAYKKAVKAYKQKLINENK